MGVTVSKAVPSKSPTGGLTARSKPLLQIRVLAEEPPESKSEPVTLKYNWLPASIEALFNFKVLAANWTS